MGTGQKILIGCVAIPLVLVVTVVSCGVVVVRRASSPGPAVANEVLDRKASELAPLTQDELSSRLISGAGTQPQRLTLDLEEGSFRIVRAALGEPLAVAGTYDDSVFAVEMAELPEGEAGSHLLVRFHRTKHAAFSFGSVESLNMLQVSIPAQQPLEMSVRMRKGEADLDLTGLPLVSLTIDAAMGETRVSFREPNPETLQRLVIRGSMGNFELDGLGHADVREIDFSGAMGNYTFDFSGTPRGDTASRMKVKMGNAEIRLPRGVRHTVSRRSARFGNVEARQATSDEVDPELGTAPPTIDFDLQASFGNMELY
ncbi:MAG: hypothetical protein OEQ13_00015 [Acidobacteriota bacterium]|nr:hypothetical protein [Acidobacteriota bacterium]